MLGEQRSKSLTCSSFSSILRSPMALSSRSRRSCLVSRLRRCHTQRAPAEDMAMHLSLSSRFTRVNHGKGVQVHGPEWLSQSLLLNWNCTAICLGSAYTEELVLMQISIRRRNVPNQLHSFVVQFNRYGTANSQRNQSNGDFEFPRHFAGTVSVTIQAYCSARQARELTLLTGSGNISSKIATPTLEPSSWRLPAASTKRPLPVVCAIGIEKPMRIMAATEPLSNMRTNFTPKRSHLGAEGGRQLFRR